MSESQPRIVQNRDKFYSPQVSPAKRIVALGLNYCNELGQKRINKEFGSPRETAVAAFEFTESGLLDNSATAAKILTVSSGLENALCNSYRFTVGSVTRCTHLKDNLSR
ncbi:hypothetical protein CLV75_1574 [Ruegeria conchae]|uniref:Uncharacterized protein n=1 Tax=Ruegeria conchae TaxID=981384 RepID=A0A497ZH17_9RHOB|nr:hypothetical protein CLV75_1574 [Ruegeria conchae]